MARIVVAAHTLPFAEVPHAGGRYLLHLDAALRELGHDVIFLAPDTPATRHASVQPGAPAEQLLLGLSPGRTATQRAVNFALVTADAKLRRLDAGLPSLAFAYRLSRDPRARRAILDADVIDLQWLDMIRLAGRFKRINRRARIVGTYHDVQSQLFGRDEVRTRGVRRLYWRANARWAARRERRGLNVLDKPLVFCEKDRLLLRPRSGDRIGIIPPPLAVGIPHRVRAQPDGRPSVVFISYLAREENDDAARWLVSEIWPRVTATVPDATLALVGAGASDRLAALVAQDGSITITGFVPDLDPWLTGAWAAVVPLRFGAGLKFKTVDAMLAGLPTVTTTVGAEGIPGADLLHTVSDTAEGIASGLISCLGDPAAASGGARLGQDWAQAYYSWDTFCANLNRAITDPA